METLFALGQCVITANAKDTLNPFDVKLALDRHLSGDWGELCATPELASSWADQLLPTQRNVLLYIPEALRPAIVGTEWFQFAAGIPCPPGPVLSDLCAGLDEG